METLSNLDNWYISNGTVIHRGYSTTSKWGMATDNLINLQHKQIYLLRKDPVIADNSTSSL